MKRLTHVSLTEERSATFSDDEAYRYELEIRWAAEKPTLIGVCLNPSTATHLVNDPTIDRMCVRALKLGCGAFVMLNIFAFRATKPAAMKAAADPVGPDNDRILSQWFETARICNWPVFLGWGGHGDHRGPGQGGRLAAAPRPRPADLPRHHGQRLAGPPALHRLQGALPTFPAEGCGMTGRVEWPDEIRWFDAVGTCRCGKPAHGVLRGPGNASFGNACTSCANRALDAARASRRRRGEL